MLFVVCCLFCCLLAWTGWSGSLACVPSFASLACAPSCLPAFPNPALRLKEGRARSLLEGVPFAVKVRTHDEL